MNDERHHHETTSHAPSKTAAAIEEAYSRAFEAAQPDPGRTVIPIELEAGEVRWEFVQGRHTPAWGFGGTVPGPTIEAHVGDVLEIRLANRLPEPTVVHWHGLRIPAAMDGTDMVQRPIAPGSTFTYRFRLPDAGTFWYHSHFNETVQLERGLYGALIVRSAEEPVFDHERVLVLDDVELQDDGSIERPVDGASRTTAAKAASGSSTDGRNRN